MDDSQPSPFPLAPVSAAILAEQETERRNHLRQLGYLKSGCAEIDDYVLQGGFERGHIVGLSAEEETLGLTLGLQILSKMLSENPETALIITPKPAGEILRSLRDSIRTSLSLPPHEIDHKVKSCLDNVMLSCVFDIDGLWQVLSDLDTKSEIQDSQDSEPALSPSSPSLILITHFSSLLTSLFTQRTKDSAHTKLSLLASHLRYLSRNLPSHPLILILNSTTDSHDGQDKRHNKPLDPSLRSIFNPPPLHIPGYVATSSRRSKPSFGLVFTQLLDLHVLASRVPRTRDDAESVVNSRDATFVTVLEVLLDEMGLWTGRMGRRMNREQRWGAVRVEGGRVVDAFAKREVVEVVEIRTSGGFGGRRA
ncbi:fasciclin domain family protein [Pochonia chlamydosporia 170]|uniref:Fasciclin domain family protein n=1 Tax=Pochonia chlamydosporia 170 TaxID=1380566 RepID=A0A179FS42_METCM|nr:fasciclin domain family protein [Pochonia chlamydosporia 170]OAQ68432.1 fasciclin domain family protein [Pochonia chlamydosporia 170]